MTRTAFHVKRQNPTAHLKVLRGIQAPYAKVYDHTDQYICPSLNTSEAYIRLLERTVADYYQFEATGWTHPELQTKPLGEVYAIKHWGHFLAYKARGITLATANRRRHEEERRIAMAWKPTFDQRMEQELKKGGISIREGNIIVSEFEAAERATGKWQFYQEYLPSPCKTEEGEEDILLKLEQVRNRRTPQERLAITRQMKKMYADIYVPASKTVLQSMRQQHEAQLESARRWGADCMGEAMLNIKSLMSRLVLYHGFSNITENHLLFRGPNAPGQHTVEFTGGLKEIERANRDIWILSQAIQLAISKRNMRAAMFDNIDPAIIWHEVKSFMASFDFSRAVNRHTDPNFFRECKSLVRKAEAREEKILMDNQKLLSLLVRPFYKGLDHEVGMAVVQRLPGETLVQTITRRRVQLAAAEAETDRRAAQAVELAALRRSERVGRIGAEVMADREAQRNADRSVALASWGRRDARAEAVRRNAMSTTSQRTPRPLNSCCVPEECKTKSVLRKAKDTFLSGSMDIVEVCSPREIKKHPLKKEDENGHSYMKRLRRSLCPSEWWSKSYNSRDIY